MIPFHVKATANADGIERIELLPPDKELYIWEGPKTHLLIFEAWLKEYLKGKEPTAKLPLLLSGPLFTLRVLQTLRGIPFGQTTTYGKLAYLAGYPGAARAVGGVMNRNPFPLIIPCHRVLASNGLGGFALGLEMKKGLLSFEKGSKFLTSLA